MTIFDLLFLFLALVSLLTWGTALIVALRGRRARALRILRNFGVSALAYLAIVAIVGVLAPQRVLRLHEPWCFDDWCLAVESVTRAPAADTVVYNVSLRLSSRALRVSQSAKGAWIYLVDPQRNRYAPEPDPSAVSLEVRLGPGESVTTSRVFRVAAGAGPLGLITGHGPAWLPAFIIADEASLLHKPTYVRLE